MIGGSRYDISRRCIQKRCRHFLARTFYISPSPAGHLCRHPGPRTKYLPHKFVTYPVTPRQHFTTASVASASSTNQNDCPDDHRSFDGRYERMSFEKSALQSPSIMRRQGAKRATVCHSSAQSSLFSGRPSGACGPWREDSQSTSGIPERRGILRRRCEGRQSKLRSCASRHLVYKQGNTCCEATKQTYVETNQLKHV